MLVLAAAAHADRFDSPRIHLRFAELEKAGGLTLGDVSRSQLRAWLLAANCTLPARDIIHLASEFSGDDLHIWVVARRYPRHERASECGAVVIHPPNPGNFRVFYRDPSGIDHDLGEVSVPSE